tara:strand:- start:18715 stop:19332 length:618 start_codon:yes stop_codon:yes gene_type:complete
MAGFQSDPQLVWNFYSERRRGVLAAEPNAGHYALAKLEERLGDRFLLTTQNVDGLHSRAGSSRVLELHGNVCMTRCLVCARAPFSDEALHLDSLPACEVCEASGRDSLLRPHIVWFGEALDGQVLARIDDFISEAGADLLFLAIGTQGAVYPAASLVDVARRVGGSSYLVNLDEADNASQFDHIVRGKSGEVLPQLFGLSSEQSN